MNIKRFRNVCRLLSGLFKVFAGFGVALLVLGFFFAIFSETSSFNFDIDGFSLFVAQSNHIEEEIWSTAALIITPLVICPHVYILLKGSALFDQLTKGYSPFNSEFTQTVKTISLILIISDIALPLLYSLFVTFLTDGYYLNIALGSSFVIGLILYAVAEIFNYGIELQELSDDTI